MYPLFIYSFVRLGSILPNSILPNSILPNSILPNSFHVSLLLFTLISADAATSYHLNEQLA